MAWFLGLGMTGVVLLALSLVFDGVLDGVLDGALDGLLDGWLSLPVVAGFTAMTGFGGAIALGTTGIDLAELLKGITRRDTAEGEQPAQLNGKVEITG